MHNNNSQKNIGPFKKYIHIYIYIYKKTPKIIKLYICKNREIKITFQKLFNFQGKQIICNKIQRINYTLYIIVATTLLSHISGHIIHQFLTFSLSFFFFKLIFLLISQLNVIFSSTFPHPFTFSSPHYYLSHYHFSSFPLSFFIFSFSYSPPLTINLQFSISFCTQFSHTHKVIFLSFSLSKFFSSFLVDFLKTFSCISTLS